jgi:hypothetical protein
MTAVWQVPPTLRGRSALPRLQHEHRNLPVRLRLVLRVRRVRRDPALPPLRTLVAADLASVVLLRRRAVLQLDMGVRDEVVVPGRVLGAPPLEANIA